VRGIRTLAAVLAMTFAAASLSACAPGWVARNSAAATSRNGLGNEIRTLIGASFRARSFALNHGRFSRYSPGRPRSARHAIDNQSSQSFSSQRALVKNSAAAIM
jgi:hypothetical protein